MATKKLSRVNSEKKMRQYDFDKELFSFFLSESEPVQFFIRLFLPWKAWPAEMAVICGLAVDGA